MAKHGYYWTPHWKALRRAALKRDGYCCTVSHCYARATVVDHIVTRPRQDEPSAEDRLDNLRSLYASHDAQIKEHKRGPNGVMRGRGGVPIVKGCDADGWPVSPR
jgi:5-methylcytosine-specific restriction endonuclease McrA